MCDLDKELRAAAQTQIERIGDGNDSVAREVLRQAAVGLRDLLRGEMPDLERREYLRFLLSALEQIDQGVDAEKALGLWTGNRPHGPDDRDLALFVAVGPHFDRLVRSGADSPVERAIEAAAKSFADRGFNIKKPTIEKAWRLCGGRGAWEAGKNPDFEKGN